MTLQPLKGLKILDFSTLLPGPMASLILAEAGAEVLKVERPNSGEEMRRYDPKWGGEAINFALLNRNKKSLAINLKDKRILNLIRPLIEDADILIEQFRPGVMDRLGLGYKAVSALNEKIIYCSITGYGQTGPKADFAAHDLNYVADTGLLDLSHGTLDEPVIPPALIADIAGGTYPAVINILLAIIARMQTNKGCHLDIAMTDHLFALSYWAIGKGAVTGVWPENGAEVFTGGSPRYQLYPTQDGRILACAALEQKFWDRFCELIDLAPDLRDDENDPQATRKAIQAIIGQRPARDWQKLFYSEDCCCNIVRTLNEALQDQHYRTRGLFDHLLENAQGDTLPAMVVPVVPQFRDHPDHAKSAPALGSHNDSILK